MRSHNSLRVAVVAVLALASAMGVAAAARDVHTFTAAELNSEPRGAGSPAAGEASAHADSLPPIALPPLWPQPFHSTRNAGFSVVHGPDGPGSCPVDLIPNSLNQATYRHTGVLSLDNQRLYVGSSINVLYIVNVSTASFIAVDLGPGNRIQGIVASPVVAKWGTPVNNVQRERVYVGSADTNVYALDPEACMASEPGCIVWSTTLFAPVMAPLHQTMNGVDSTVQTNGVVYASTTSNVSDATAAGVMYRLDCNTGDRLAHIEAASIDRTETWPIHSAPVIDNCVDSPFIGIVYMTFGHRIVALDPANLQVLNELTPNDTIAQDPYQSSLSMGPDCKSLFVQSRSKRLWRIDVLGKDLNSMEMVLRWRCLYSATDSDCCIPPWCDASYVEREQLSLGYDEGDPMYTNVFSTPAFNNANQHVVVGMTKPQLPTADQVGGAFSVNASNGVAIYRLIQHDNIIFANGRSSPVVDPTGSVYIGTDSEYGGQDMPVIFALYPNFTVKFVSLLADDGAILAAASPLLMQTEVDGVITTWIVSSGGDKIRSIKQGKVCPTTSLNPLIQCSGSGVCDCETGVCTCNDPCFVDDACAVVNNCNDNGHCINGNCQCNSPCFGPPDCGSSIICGNHGSCTTDPAGAPACSCEGCYSGIECEVLQTCSGHGSCIPSFNDQFKCQCTGGYSGGLCATSPGVSPGGGGDGLAIGLACCFVFVFVVVVGVILMRQWRTGKGMFKAKPRMRRGRRTLDVIYEEDEADSTGLVASSKGYGSAYTTL